MIELTNPIVYVSRDIERALGFDINTTNYYIISNDSNFATKTKEDRENVLLIKNEKILDTYELLQNPEVVEFVNKFSNPQILVFKNTIQIERICTEKNWTLLNPPAELVNRVEQKISQVEWLGDLSKFLPKHKIELCGDLKWNEENFILQFNRSHTGSGTILVESAKQLIEIKEKFPKREARITKYIDGSLFTNNNSVTKNGILFGNISYQITGLASFTKQKFATIGNDWGFANTFLNEEQKTDFFKIAKEVGEKLQKDGWSGLFGIDVILEKETGKMYLIEINARQPASTTFESTLQTPHSKEEITTFDAHLVGLLDLETNSKVKQIENGAQIILRKQSETNITELAKKLCAENFTVIQYENEKMESDLLRIQSNESLISAPNKLNELGEKIKNIIST
ncbi:MAG: ATP-grasp domain-containing protein [Candidatus Magasanikbacteria bacterium]|nr:ATP-grasp domain-containing protein [Candidatus Magasanikbacteria bacterium]